MSTRDAASKLAELGFNVVPIGADKKPLGTWSAEKPLFKPEDFDRAEAVAITGYYNADEQYRTLILDIDSPEEATPKLNEIFDGDWRTRLCGAPWSFCGLSGPRCPVDGDKHYIQCSDGICTHAPPGEEPHQFELDNAERGMYVVLRVPAKCLPQNMSTRRGGSLELIYRNYQVVYGRHPSGVTYAPVRWQDGKWVSADFGPGELIDCDELARLVRSLEEKKEETQYDDEKGELPQPNKEVDRETAKDVVEMLKKLWTLVSPGGGHYHDFLIFAIVSLARRAGVTKESVMEIFDEIFSWAVAEGHDSEREVENHHRKVIEWVYSKGRPDNIWGRKRFEELVRNIAKDHGLGDNFAEMFISSVYKAFGITIGRPTCIAIAYKRTHTSSEKIRYICNTPRGVLEVVKVDDVDEEKMEECMAAKPDDVPASEWRKKCKKEARVETYKDKVLLNVFFTSASKYHDAILNVEYISATWNVVGTPIRDSVSMARYEEFVNSLSKKHKVMDSPRWNVVFDGYETTVDIIVSGFACPPPSFGLPCKVRDYFGTGVDKDPDPPKAAEAFQELLSLLDKYKPSDMWAKKMLYSIAQGMFASFSLTRKLWQVRPVMVLLVGRRHTGKTTVARIIKWMFYPKARDEDIIRGASTVLRAARIGRMQGEIVTTWLTLDEVDAIAKSQEEQTLSVLKSYATSLEAWRTATGERYPAYAGILMTANKIEFSDPDIVDKLIAIEFDEQTPRERESQFSSELFKVVPKLVDFGAYYLKYAERNWEKVKEVILGNPPETMAIRYFNEVLESLGIGYMLEPLNALTEVVASSKELLRRYIYRILKEYQGECRDYTAFGCLDVLVERYKVPYIKPYDKDHYRIKKEIKAEIGANIESLCQELGGKIYINSNPEYYKSCIVEKKAIDDLLTE